MNNTVIDARIERLVSSLIADESALQQLMQFYRKGHTAESMPDAILQGQCDTLCAWADSICHGGGRDIFYYLHEFLIRHDQMQPYMPVYELLMSGTPRRVLDVGCGIGQTVRTLAERWPARYTAMEHNPIARILARIATRSIGGVDVVAGNAEHLDFPDASFDRIHCRGVLQYTYSPRAMAEMARCLSSGGRLYLKVADWRFYAARLCHGLVRPSLRSIFLNVFPLVNGMLCLGIGQPLGFSRAGNRFQEHFIGHRLLERLGHDVGLELMYEDCSLGSPTPTSVWEKRR
jgi:SAM-dependent methyltransferase